MVNFCLAAYRAAFTSAALRRRLEARAGIESALKDGGAEVVAFGSKR